MKRFAMDKLIGWSIFRFMGNGNFIYGERLCGRLREANL